jgi:ABC-type polysaccharide/polyol phosphate transport system ATPase subunit
MTEPIVIQAENLGKVYRLYERPIDRLKEALHPLGRRYHRDFHALNGLSFSIRRGETVGIVGRNGSGKSTLLKILTGVLSPTSGTVRVNGRISALLELGAGFNPEFTGMENVYLQGTMAGYTRQEMESRIPTILTFADIGDFVGQPVKHYSSGMFVRLAFACAISADPDILIVDEALAVGDVAFQVKCMSRMRGLQQQGTTILLVTHDVNTVRSSCSRALWIHNGMLGREGSPRDVTARYLESLFAPEVRPASPSAMTPPAVSVEVPDPTPVESSCIVSSAHELPALPPLAQRTDLIRWGSGEIRVVGATLRTGRPGAHPVSEYGDRICVEFDAAVVSAILEPNVGFAFSVRNMRGLDIITYTTHEAGCRVPSPSVGMSFRVSCEFQNVLASGDYVMVLCVEGVNQGTRHYYDFVENGLLFKVVSDRNIFSAVLPPVQCSLTMLQVNRREGVSTRD